MPALDLLRPRTALRRRESEMPSLWRPFEDMRRMMEDFWTTPFGELDGWREGFSPKVDVKEEEDNVIVRAELPGVDSKDVDVTVENDTIRIAGEKKREEEEEAGCYRCETSYGSFERILDLPAEVDEEKAEAEFHQGVLTIKLPKSEEARAKRKKIQIKSA